MPLETLSCVAALCLAYLLTWYVRQHSLRNKILDLPNARSSHSLPIPRGGGLAVATVIGFTTLLFWSVGRIDEGISLSIVIGGGMVAGIGYIDDTRGVNARIRFSIHALAAVFAVVLLGGKTIAHVVFPLLPQELGVIILVLGICWSVNLFNFMDGIDGIAASEFIFICIAAAILIFVSHRTTGLGSLLVVFACAAMGFILWNWAPAKIFMGDVGSGFLGYLLALLAIYSSLKGELSIWTWIILYSVFIADATVTLVRRVLSGKRWYEAHRSHAYQHLAIRRRSHAQVCGIVLGANTLLAAPIAYWSVNSSSNAMLLAFGTLLFFGAMSAFLNAGKSDPTQNSIAL